MIDIILCCYKTNLVDLKRSIESVLTQTNTAWILYIVNDGDGLYLENFLNKERYLNCPKIKYLKHNVNKGLPTALNTGHNAGTGEFISWTSVDNYCNSNFVEEMLKIADRYDFIRSLERHFRVASGGELVNDPRTGHSQLPKDSIVYDGYLGASHLYRRSFYNATTGYDPNLSGIEDLDMYYQLMKQNPRVGFVEKVLYNYQIGSSVFNYDKVKQARDRFAAKWKGQ